MKYNKTEVLLLTKNSQLLEAFASIFSDEMDFSCRSVLDLSELNDLSETFVNKVSLVDLSNDFNDLNTIFGKKDNRVLSSPIIFILDNEGSRADLKKEGFKCFDVVLKPVDVNELLSNIRVLVGNKILSHTRPIYIRGNRFKPKNNIFENSQGVSIRLTEKETKIINFLYEGNGEVRSKDLILRAIWGYKKTISTHTVETHIYRLRKKLERGLNEKNLILKGPKGYFLNLSEETQLQMKENG